MREDGRGQDDDEEECWWSRRTGRCEVEERGMCGGEEWYSRWETSREEKWCREKDGDGEKGRAVCGHGVGV